MFKPGDNQVSQESIEETEKPFGFNEEEAVVSFALDFPDLFGSMIHFIKPELFNRIEVQFVISFIKTIFKEHEVIPTRRILQDRVSRYLTVDHPHEEIMKIIERPSDAREAPLIKKTLKEWAQQKQYGLLYSEEALAAFRVRDYDRLQEIFDGASRISDTTYRGFWFFKDFEELLDRLNVTHYRTGFPALDGVLNDGGPSPGHALIWLAATNVGKSIWLCNNSVNSVAQGLDTLHITCEMSNRDTARRILGAMVQRKMKNFSEEKDTIRSQVNRFYNSNKGRLAIYEFNPEEISVDHISQLMLHLKRTQNFQPKIVVIDYLELLLSRRDAYNDDEYSRQKHVSTEIHGLAKKENVLVYAATQTNRSGSGQRAGQNANGSGQPIDLNQAAESYGKTMPVDYVVSLNQTKEQRIADLPTIDMFIAKNRHGPKGGTISCHIDYDTMKVLENVI